MPHLPRYFVLSVAMIVPAAIQADEASDAIKALEQLGGSYVKRQQETLPQIKFSKPLDDAGLKAAVDYLRKLPPLESLDLSGSTVTADGIKELRDLNQLQSLTLQTGRDGDALCEAITALKSLTSLDLSDSGVTDDGLAKLASLPNLKNLTLRNSPEIHGRGFKAFIDGKTLETVDLTDSRPTAAGLRYLSQIPSLTRLNLQGTRVGDSGLMQLAGHKKLMGIDLSRTYVTDDGVLPFICMFRKFSMLDVRNTRVSRDVAARIERLGKVTELRYNR